jgi:hypothetical protein
MSLAESAIWSKKKDGYQMTLKYPPMTVPIPSKARNETNVRICGGSCEIKEVTDTKDR